MGMTFDQLTQVSTLAKEDIIALLQATSGTNVGASLEALSGFINSTSNGYCRGNWYQADHNKDIDAADGSDIGVWKWTLPSGSQARTDFPYTYALMEIIRHEKTAGTNNDYDIVQRMNVGDAIYQRFKSETTQSWSAFKRFDVDYDVKYGAGEYSTPGQQVLFTSSQVNPGSFIASATPRVFVIPLNPSPDHAFFAQIYGTDANGFTFAINHQQLDLNGTIPVISVDFSNSTTSNTTELSQYIADYCVMDRTTATSFFWFAIAPRTVSGS